MFFDFNFNILICSLYFMYIVYWTLKYRKRHNDIKRIFFLILNKSGRTAKLPGVHVEFNIFTSLRNRPKTTNWTRSILFKLSPGIRPINCFWDGIRSRDGTPTIGWQSNEGYFLVNTYYKGKRSEETQYIRLYNGFNRKSDGYKRNI